MIYFRKDNPFSFNARRRLSIAFGPMPCQCITSFSLNLVRSLRWCTPAAARARRAGAESLGRSLSELLACCFMPTPSQVGTKAEHCLSQMALPQPDEALLDQLNF